MKVDGNFLPIILDIKIRPKRTTEAKNKGQLMWSARAVFGLQKLVM
jgi:hypothetical protein